MPGQEFKLFTSLRYDPKLLMLQRHHGEDAVKTESTWNYSKASPLYMLDYHRDRMLRAATHWGWTAAVAALSGEQGLGRLEAFILALPEVGDHPLRIKVTLSKDGRFDHEASRIPEVPLSNLFPPLLPSPEELSWAADQTEEKVVAKEPVHKVVVDQLRTQPSEFTHFKTTKREMYDGARHRANISLPDLREVLLVSASDANVMEGSLTTPYFWRNGRWVTPPVAPVFSTDAGSGGQDGTSRRWALERGLCVEEAVNVSSLKDGEDCWLSNGVRGFMFGEISMAS